MSLTGQELLVGLSKFVNDYETGTTTSAGASDGSTLIDSALQKYQSNRLKGRYARVTTAGSNQYYFRPVEQNAAATGTLDFTSVFPVQVGAAVNYELHRFDPAKKFRALDEARFDVSDYAYRLVYDETITGDGNSFVFPIPTNMALGPIQVYEETPVSAQNIIWNFITSAIGDSTSPWTATGCTAEIVNINYTDLIVPKYDYASTKISVAATTAATYAQPVSEMANGITAALAAGRKMTFGMWVYCRQADRITLSLTDDSGATSSTAHQGLGWELLALEKDVVGNNATTLTATLNVSSGDALTLYWNRTWLYYGAKERITEVYTDESFQTVRRDAETQTFMLNNIPQRGHQIRLIGQDFLSPLGSNQTTQTTNTMEVTEGTALMLYARAAELLLEWEGMVASDIPDVYQRIATVRQREVRVDKFRQQVPSRSVRSPFFQ